MKIGQTIRHGKENYQVTSFMSYEGFENITKAAKESGKYNGMFSACKVLKNGKLSEKQGICFYAFINSDNIIIL